MKFESWVNAFAERFLSDRTFELIVAPALADLQFEQPSGWVRQAEHRVAVLRAVAGGLRDDAARGCGSFVMLMLLPICYHVFLLLICFDFFSISLSTGFVAAATLIVVLSLGPVLACFWPQRRTPRTVD